ALVEAETRHRAILQRPDISAALASHLSEQFLRLVLHVLDSDRVGDVAQVHQRGLRPDGLEAIKRGQGASMLPRLDPGTDHAGQILHGTVAANMAEGPHGPPVLVSGATLPAP